MSACRPLRSTIVVALVSVVAASAAAFGATGIDWTAQATPADSSWQSVAYGNGLFVAVAQTGDAARVMTSGDGVTWTARQAAAARPWQSVAYGAGQFVAVSGEDGQPGAASAVMTSPDGANWTSRAPASGNLWASVTHGNGLYVAVGSGPGTGDRVMTSPDGITWTSRASAADVYWRSVTYARGLFVAVGGRVNNLSPADRIMTSPDGVSWTSRAVPSPSGNYYSVTYGNGVFVAVGAGGPNSTGVIMTSPDGITWTARSGPAGSETNSWRGVAYGDGQFVAVARQGPTRVATSPDGITWTTRTAPADNAWYSVTYADNIFVSVSQDGGGRQVMTSGTLFPARPATPTAVAGDARATVTVRPGTSGLGTGGPVTRFTVTASPGGSTCTVTEPGGGACEVPALANGTAYTFSAVATNGAGTSAASPASAAVTPTAATSPVARLSARTRCVLGRCVTTGAVPAGAIRITQAARSVRGSRRATGRCVVTTRRTGASRARTYTCTMRLSKGHWLLAFPVVIFVATFTQATFGDGNNWEWGTAGVIVLPTLLAIVVRGKYPSYVLTFNHAVIELSTRLAAYVLILNDKYPSIEANSKVAVLFPDVEGGKKLNRWLPLVKWFLAIPHYIVGAVYLVISLVVTFIAWIQTSITGKYPEWAGEIVLGTISYWNRVQGYMLLLVTDKYPTFRLK